MTLYSLLNQWDTLKPKIIRGAGVKIPARDSKGQSLFGRQRQKITAFLKSSPVIPAKIEGNALGTNYSLRSPVCPNTTQPSLR